MWLLSWIATTGPPYLLRLEAKPGDPHPGSIDFREYNAPLLPLPPSHSTSRSSKQAASSSHPAHRRSAVWIRRRP